MILVDTCIWSELMRERPDPNVVAWMTVSKSAMSAITVQELHRGVALLPAGRRRDGLGAMVTRLMASVGDPVPYDGAAGEVCGELLARLERAGTPIGGLADAQIAATALARDVSVATRNVRHFQACGVPVINPFEYRADR